MHVEDLDLPFAFVRLLGFALIVALQLVRQVNHVSCIFTCRAIHTEVAILVLLALESPHEYLLPGFLAEDYNRVALFLGNLSVTDTRPFSSFASLTSPSNLLRGQPTL